MKTLRVSRHFLEAPTELGKTIRTGVDMKNFLAIYMGSPTSENAKRWNALSPDEQKARSEKGMKAWQAWGEKNQASIVEHGAPLGKTKKADPIGIRDIKNQMAAYTIVRAESHDAAVKLFIEHPHFTIFPGDSVEVMECLPMPS